MKLITKGIEKRFNKVGEQIETSNPFIVCKLFTPRSSWTWYITEYNISDGVCYGYVIGNENERGYFALSELENLKGPYGLKIERDIHFDGCFFNSLNI